MSQITTKRQGINYRHKVKHFILKHISFHAARIYSLNFHTYLYNYDNYHDHRLACTLGYLDVKIPSLIPSSMRATQLPCCDWPG